MSSLYLVIRFDRQVATVIKLRLLACAAALGLARIALAAPADLVPPSPAWVKISVAELRAGYDTLWAISDLHGRRKELEALLVASGLALRTDAALTWNPARRRQLLLVAGDLIDGGPDSVGVVLLLDQLQREATAANSRIVVLLGNHDAAFLARPRSATSELLSSGARHAAELGIQGRITPEQLEASAVGNVLRRLPVGAFVGSWLFVHAGCIDAGKKPRAVGEYFARVAESVERRDRSAFAALLDPDSIVACHGWSRSGHALATTRRRIEALGLNGLLIGHEPDALGAHATMAVNRDGWLLKLDVGLKRRESAGMLLRCDVARIVSSEALVMLRDGVPTCSIETQKGSKPLPIVR